MAWILLWSSAVRVHDSQAHRKMDVTREHISCILELREILLSIQTAFSLVNAAVVCAILDSISGLNPHQLLLSPGIWSLWLSQPSVHSLWSLCWCHWCCLSSAWSSRHWSPCHRLWRLCSSSSPAKPSMSSAKWRLVIVLPPMLTVPSWSSKASVMILSRNMLKRVGESRHPCQTPTVVQNQSPMLLLKERTALAALQRFLMTWIRFVLILYLFMVAHKAACQTLLKAFLKSMKTW